MRDSRLGNSPEGQLMYQIAETHCILQLRRQPHMRWDERRKRVADPGGGECDSRVDFAVLTWLPVKIRAAFQASRAYHTPTWRHMGVCDWAEPPLGVSEADSGPTDAKLACGETCICPSIWPYVFVYVFIYLSIYLSISTHLSTHLSK